MFKVRGMTKIEGTMMTATLQPPGGVCGRGICPLSHAAWKSSAPKGSSEKQEKCVKLLHNLHCMPH